MELEVDEASKSLVASWFSDESFDTEPEDTPTKTKKNKKKVKVEKTGSPIVKQKSIESKKSSPLKATQSAKTISSMSSFVEEKLKKKLKKSKHIKDDEKKETEMKFTGMKKNKLSTAADSSDEEESKAASVAKKSPSQTPVERHTVESLQQKLKDDSLSNTSKKKLKKKLNALLSDKKEGSESTEKQSGNNNSETKVAEKKNLKANDSKTETKLVNGADVKGGVEGKKEKKEKKMMEKQKKKQLKSDEPKATEKTKPKKRQKEESSSDESDADVQMVTKKPKVKISDDSGTPDRSKHSIVTLEQKLNVTTSQVARKNIRKKIAELKARQQVRKSPMAVSRGELDMSSDSSESEDMDAVMENATKKSKSPVKESLIDKLKKLKSPSLEKSGNSTPSTPASTKKRSAAEASMGNDLPTKLKKKSKVQAEGGDAAGSPEKSVEERLDHFYERLKEKGLSSAAKKRIRRQIKKLKPEGKETESPTKTKEGKTKKTDSAIKAVKAKKKDSTTKETKTKKLKSATKEDKTKKPDPTKKKDKKKKEKKIKKKESDDEDMMKETEGWESDGDSDGDSAGDSGSEEAPKKKKKAKEGHIRKRVKKRSKQKNIKKDNRPDHLKPPHLRMGAKEGSDDSS